MKEHALLGLQKLKEQCTICAMQHKVPGDEPTVEVQLREFLASPASLV